MRRILPLLIAVVALAAACGDSSDPAAGVSNAKLPDTEHIQVATGETVRLTDEAGGTPTLAWFWAPH